MFNMIGRHPWLYAKDQFMAGAITREQAACMASNDREFDTEVMLDGRFAGMSTFEAAVALVDQVWLPALVATGRGRP